MLCKGRFVYLNEIFLAYGAIVYLPVSEGIALFLCSDYINPESLASYLPRP